MMLRSQLVSRVANDCRAKKLCTILDYESFYIGEAKNRRKSCYENRVNELKQKIKLILEELNKEKLIEDIEAFGNRLSELKVKVRKIISSTKMVIEKIAPKNNEEIEREAKFFLLTASLKTFYNFTANLEGTQTQHC